MFEFTETPGNLTGALYTTRDNSSSFGSALLSGAHKLAVKRGHGPLELAASRKNHPQYSGRKGDVIFRSSLFSLVPHRKHEGNPSTFPQLLLYINNCCRLRPRHATPAADAVVFPQSRRYSIRHEYYWQSCFDTSSSTPQQYAPVPPPHRHALNNIDINTLMKNQTATDRPFYSLNLETKTETLPRLIQQKRAPQRLTSGLQPAVHARLSLEKILRRYLHLRF